MDKDIVISQGLGDLSLYFRRKLNIDVEKMYREKFIKYHVKTIARFFKDWRDQQERFPFIHEVITALQNLEELPVDYSQHPEKFPILKMWDGFHILKEKGTQSFIFYCDSVNMPPEDRERVMQKHRMAYPDINKISKKLFPESPSVTLRKQREEQAETLEDEGPEQGKWRALREKAAQMKRQDPEYKNHIRKTK